MGWKSLKEHYRIEHLLEVRKDHLVIGSEYIPKIITVTFEGQVSWEREYYASGSNDLQRLYREMSEDPSTVKRLLEAPDTFEQDLPVYTFEDGIIVEKKCEKHGYPNLTHDGKIQYENVFFSDERACVATAINECNRWIEHYDDRLKQLHNERLSYKVKKAHRKQSLHTLQRDYPQPQPNHSPDHEPSEEITTLGFLADIRAALGDPTGKLTQDELLDHCRKLAAAGTDNKPG